jgi:hypothetical protein
MSAWLNRKVDPTTERPVCPRCGAPSSETSVLCERHRLDAIERQSRWRGHRPARRAAQKCAFCKTPSATYRCRSCKEKRRRWDAGKSISDLPPAQAQEVDAAPAVTASIASPEDPDKR